jgi:hypothetical protein
MIEFTVNEDTPEQRSYQVGKLNAMQQFHVTRRLGPVLVVAGITVDMLRKGVKMELGGIVALAGPVMEVLSKMTDEETEYIIFTCLSVCKLRQGEGWAPLMSPDGKKLMFSNLELPEMVRVVCEVLKDNLGNFLPGLGVELTSQSSSGQGQQGATQ